jgi:eukaryotic-like serine/threonine-protein kinase
VVASQVFTGRYQMVRQVARGGMAEVYLARDLLLDRPVALKVLFPEFSTDPSFVERFRREARAAANLNHPGIVSIYDWGQEGRTYFIVMEYVDGRTLREVIRSEGPLLAHRAAEIGADIAGALHFAHQHNCVHRDVKPGNVMIAGQQVKVTDFGIARAGDSGGENLTQTGAVMGTATYFSPEQAQGHDVDARSDVYSLGVVLYEMVTGRPPFKGDNPVAIAYQHVREQPVPPSEINPDVPRVFDAIILKAMAKDTASRYQTAEALRADLLRYAAGQPVSVEPVGLASFARPSEAPAPAAPAAAVTGIMARTNVGGANGSAFDGTRIASAGERVPDYEEPPRQRTGIYIGILVTLLVILGGLLYLLSRELGVGGGNVEIAMPTVIGKTEAEANTILREAGLRVTRREVADEVNEAGKVVDQDPDPGVQVKKDSEVTISVSQGPPSATIPDVRGRKVDAATDALDTAGFDVKTVRRTDVAAAVDTVIDQDPKPGPGKRGAIITLIVSNGPDQVRVPEVRGKPEGEAANLLGQAGFLTQTRVEQSATVPSGLVIRTEPDVGTRLDKGDTVTLVVSNGAPATTSPPLPTVTSPPTTGPLITIFPTTTTPTTMPTTTTT